MLNKFRAKIRPWAYNYLCGKIARIEKFNERKELLDLSTDLHAMARPLKLTNFVSEPKVNVAMAKTNTNTYTYVCFSVTFN